MGRTVGLGGSWGVAATPSLSQSGTTGRHGLRGCCFSRFDSADERLSTFSIKLETGWLIQDKNLIACLDLEIANRDGRIHEVFEFWAAPSTRSGGLLPDWKSGASDFLELS
jgi:hypothetical protein